MGRAVEVIAAGLFVLCLAAVPARADEAADQAARAVVETLVQDAHDAMVATDVEKLKAAISDALAFDVWEKFLIGDRDLAPEQRNGFRALLPGFLADLYAEQFGKGLEAAPEVVGTRTVRRDVLVKARIPRANAEPLPVEYRVRAFPDRGAQVIDIMVGGVSFLVLKRDEFGALIEKDGPEALLDFMRRHAR